MTKALEQNFIDRGFDIVDLDCAEQAAIIEAAIRHQVGDQLRKRGAVVAVSGGVDSAVCVALTARALGPDNVLGLALPERESSADSTRLARQVTDSTGVGLLIEDISETLEAVGCYQHRDAAIRTIFPDYKEGWKSKLALAEASQAGMRFFHLIVQAPDGEMHKQRLAHSVYLEIIAATSYKQRTRKTLEYYHADRQNYAVVGSANRLEYEQGFFVRNGDGSADLKPIAHLYKRQVYQLARWLELPEAICTAVPTTDTYTMEQGQDEFFFGLPFREMDVALWGFNHSVSAQALAQVLGISEQNAAAVYADIDAKKKVARVLGLAPLLVSDAS